LKAFSFQVGAGGRIPVVNIEDDSFLLCLFDEKKPVVQVELEIPTTGHTVSPQAVPEQEVVPGTPLSDAQHSKELREGAKTDIDRGQGLEYNTLKLK